MPLCEETPLLYDNGHECGKIKEHDLAYERFNPRQKRILLAIVSWCGLMPLFVSATIYPSIPQMVSDFNSTPQIIGLTVSISMFSASVGALIVASCSTFYGRRPVYLFALPLLIIGSFGVSASCSVFQLFFFRVIQAAGASSGFSIGAGVIGDIYKLEERGTAIGIFLAAVLVGPSLAPVAGGLAAQYASWRLMQLFVGLFGLTAFGITWAFLPETSHYGTRGIDKLRQKEEQGQVRWRKYAVNPLSPLGLLKAPNIVAVMLSSFTVLVSVFVILVPIAYTIGTRYNINNNAILGLCAIPGGIGETFGAFTSGCLSDYIVIRRRKATGDWCPEDRLRGTIVGALFLVPLSMIFSGLLIEYVEGPVSQVFVFICFFLNGLGLELVLSPSTAYVVDVLHSRSTEALAAIDAARSVMLSFAVAGIMPMIDAYGIFMTSMFSALLAWTGFGLLWLTIQYGEDMRNWCDIGFSTVETT